MAGKSVRVLVTPTADLGKILSCMHGLELGGETSLLSGLQVAQLALKHRQNKNQRQRIVLFIGSPLHVDTETLVRTGKKLKKNNVALDVVSFGEEEEDKAAKLEALLTAVNSNDNSHLVHVPPGGYALSDVLISSPIFTGDGEGGSGFAAAAAAGAAAAAAAAGGLGSGMGDFEFGVDPSLDPELALALRVSMEEERARQEAAARRAAVVAAEGEEGKGEAAAGGAADGGGSVGDAGIGAAGSDERDVGVADVTAVTKEEGMSSAAPSRLGTDTSVVLADFQAEAMDEDSALLQQALALSMAEAMTDASAAAGAGSTPPDAADGKAATATGPAAGNGGGSGDGVDGLAAAAPSTGMLDLNNVLGDAAFVNSILASLPGVDPNDPSVRDALASLSSETKQDEKSKEEE